MNWTFKIRPVFMRIHIKWVQKVISEHYSPECGFNSLRNLQSRTRAIRLVLIFSLNTSPGGRYSRPIEHIRETVTRRLTATLAKLFLVVCYVFSLSCLSGVDMDTFNNFTIIQPLNNIPCKQNIVCFLVWQFKFVRSHFL